MMWMPLVFSKIFLLFPLKRCIIPARCGHNRPVPLEKGGLPAMKNSQNNNQNSQNNNRNQNSNQNQNNQNQNQNENQNKR